MYPLHEGMVRIKKKTHGFLAKDVWSMHKTTQTFIYVKYSTHHICSAISNASEWKALLHYLS